MPPVDFGKLLNIGYWMDTDPPAPSLYFTVLLIVFASGLALGLYLYYLYAPNSFRDHSYKRRLWQRVGSIMAIVGGVGAFMATMRIVQFAYLSTRVLMLLTVLASVGFVGYFGFYMITRYSRELARYESWALRQRYMPRAGRKVRTR